MLRWALTRWQARAGSGTACAAAVDAATSRLQAVRTTSAKSSALVGKYR